MLTGMTWKKWILGLIDATISGAANGITVVFVDPHDFNFNEGVGKLGAVMFVSAVVSLALYIKSHRLPGLED